MLKNTVLLAATMAAAMVIMPAAAQKPGSPIQASAASGASDFTAQDWTAAGRSELTELPEVSATKPSLANGYSLTDPSGNPSSVTLGYGLDATPSGLDADPFLLDKRFQFGTIRIDRFTNNSDANGMFTDKYARKVLRLSNGDVVSVALVPKLGAMTEPASSVGRNIGMFRFTAAGVRQKWTHAASAFTESQRNYYVFPNKDVYDNNGAFFGIADVKEHNGWIYVLARRHASATDYTTDVRLVRFSLTSGEWKWNSVASYAGTSEWGAGMHFYSDGGFDKLTIVVGRTVSTNDNQTWALSYLVGDKSSLIPDPSFGTNGVQNASLAGCTDCKPVAIAGSAIDAGVTYIVGNYHYGSNNLDGYIIKLDKHGARLISFGSDGAGFKRLSYYPPKVADAKDEVHDIVVAPDTSGSESVFVLSAVADVCNTTSADVSKLNSDGFYDTFDFGPESKGQLLFGGGGTPPGCTATRSMTPYAMALNGNRLAIVGYSKSYFQTVPPGTPNITGGPSFSVVDKNIGYASDSREFRPDHWDVDIGDTGSYGYSKFVSVVANDADSFYVTGMAKNTMQDDTQVSVMTASVRADRIFGDGLQ